jgi:hypothetical protein
MEHHPAPLGSRRKTACGLDEVPKGDTVGLGVLTPDTGCPDCMAAIVPGQGI